jgi:DNA-binding beta-propeller fold protein YncE
MPRSLIPRACDAVKSGYRRLETRFAEFVFFLFIAFLFCGCASQKQTASQQQVAPLIWPEPPDPPRIAYVKSIFRPAELGIKASALTRFGRWLIGSEKMNQGLLKPFGIAVDENDNLCITDTGANTVSYYDEHKKHWQRWDKLGNLRFISPVALVKRGGNFFVADSGLGSVLAFDEKGKLWRQITNHLERPSGLVVVNNELFVSDSQRHCVVVFDLTGLYQREFGHRGNGEGQFNFPTHLGADRDGHLLITDSLNSRVQICDTNGKFLAFLGAIGDSPGHFSRPKGVASDSFGHIYVLDALFDNLQIFDPKGQLLLTLGAAGSGPGEFWMPNGIAINRNNDIFVTDSYNHRVQVFKYVGEQ